MMSDRQGPILFDLTQLVLRSGFATPTGIQRVELAYARYLLDHHRGRTSFLIALPPTAQIVPKPVAARFIAATEAAWDASDGQVSAKRVERLIRFLGADPCAPGRAAASRSTAKHKSRLLLGADVMMWAILQTVRPQSLAALSKTGRRITYICVSGSRVPAPWISSWLQDHPNVSGVFLLHDLIPVTHPEYARPQMAERHRRYVERLTHCASTIITNSQFTADSLTRFAGEHGLKTPRTIVARLGVGTGFTRRRAPLPGMPPYFVFVGTIEPRKNHILLLQVWQRLVVHYGEAAPKLLLVGKRGWENENVLDLLDRGSNLRSQVLECNSICDDVLIDLIANARALLLPSHVEGYGLPVAEALALGTPVICSDLPSLREIAGDIPEYVDPLAGRGWARTIMDYADPSNLRRLAQLQRLRSFRAPTWSDHFKTLETSLPEAGLGTVDIEDVPPVQSAPTEVRSATVYRLDLEAEARAEERRARPYGKTRAS